MSRPSRAFEPAGTGPVFRMAITEPTAIDPYRAQEIEGIGVTKLLFGGLLRLDERQRLAPAVARTWQSSPDGALWTFELNRDVRFSNGEPVDAPAFVRGLNRALDPAAGTETAYHVAAVRGFAEVRSGAASTLAGLTAPDRWTLVFELAHPDVEFDLKTLQPIFSPVPECAGPAVNPAYNDRPVGNGPFVMVEPWRHGESITLRRNPEWSGPAPAVAEVHIDVLDQARSLNDEYEGFLAGRYDYARIPAELVPEARRRFTAGGGFIERDLPGLHYLIPFCHREPMDDVWARRAISCAIDREGLAHGLFSGTRAPATSLLSPWFAEAHTPGLGGAYTRFDPQLARTCADKAGLSGPVDLAYNTGAGHDGWVTAVAGQLRDNLGIEVRPRTMNAHELVAYRTSIDAAGLCRAGWAYDYPTPDNLLYPLLHSGCTAPDANGTAHGDNEGRYVNPDFDRAVELARGTTEAGARLARWREAERLAMDDLALIPLWYRTEYRVFAADRFTNLDLDFFGNPTLTTLSITGGTNG